MTKIPEIYGCEIESAITDDHGKDIESPFLVPERFYTSSSRPFYPNGYKIYLDGSHLEIATPECRGLREISLYIRAAEQLLVSAASIGATQSDDDTTYTSGDSWVIHRRVADAKDNTWGVHDNFSVLDFDLDFEHQGICNSQAVRSFAWLLAARSVISGAGQVHDNWYYMSQKLPTVNVWNNRQHLSGLYRLSPREDRLEVRCSDDNVFDRPTRLRYAVVAFAIATGLLDDIETDVHSDDRQFFINLAKSQEVHFLPDGTIAPNTFLTRHAAILTELGNRAIAYCKEHTLGLEYTWAAQEILKQADLFTGSLQGNAPIEQLAIAGTEWAIKAATMQRHLRKNHKAPDEYDEKCRMADLQFDYIAVPKLGKPKYGWGYKHRDLGVTDPIKPEEVIQATELPPLTTRAYDRAKLIKGGKIVNGWGIADVNNPVGYYNRNPGKRILA